MLPGINVGWILFLHTDRDLISLRPLQSLGYESKTMTRIANEGDLGSLRSDQFRHASSDLVGSHLPVVFAGDPVKDEVLHPGVHRVPHSGRGGSDSTVIQIDPFPASREEVSKLFRGESHDSPRRLKFMKIR
jgi:hypothetical protein